MLLREDIMRLFDEAVDATAKAERAQNAVYSALYTILEEGRVLDDEYEEIVDVMQQYLMCELGDCFTLYNYKTRDDIKQMVYDAVCDFDEDDEEEE